LVRANQEAQGIKTPFVLITIGVTLASGVPRAKLNLEAKVAKKRKECGVNEVIEH
jgi:hypothetical protein